MANPLSFDIDADGEKARQELRKLARDNANLREEVRKLAEDSRRYSQDETTSRREVSNAIVEGAAKINLLRMAWEGVRDAVGAAIESEKEYLEYQERIRGAQQTFGEALTGAVRNLPTGVSAGQLERDIKTIAGRAKVDPTELAQNFETFLSASSGNYERSLATAEAVSKAIPFGSDARGTVGAAALDLLKTAPTGTRPEDAIGVILAAAGQARTTDIGAFADNVNAGVASLNKYGGDAASNAAIIAAMTSGATDKTGATSATASIALIEQATKFGIGGSPLEQIRALQQDADLRGRFLDSASFEKKTMATVRGLLQPGSGDASALDAALLAIPKIETAGAALDSLIKNYQSSGAIRGAMASQAGDTTTMVGLLNQEREANAGLAYKLARDAEDLIGVGSFMRTRNRIGEAYVRHHMYRQGADLDDAAVRAAIGTVQTVRGENQLTGDQSDRLMTILEELVRLQGEALKNTNPQQAPEGMTHSPGRFAPVAPNQGLER